VYLVFKVSAFEGYDGETKRWREHISQVCDGLGSSPRKVGVGQWEKCFVNKCLVRSLPL